ncbi:MAG TPA: hypothetical protein VM012_06605 [Flavitalea sp.]|nr:hypothetical protein [Flavitalea sp.]
MNKIFGLFIFSVVIFSSCTKEDTPPDPPVIQKTAEELLTAHPWKIQEIRYVHMDVLHHYQRGGTPGDVEYLANESLQFNPNGTGITDNNAPLTWEFIDGAKTKLKFTINFTSGPVITNWEHIVLKENLLTYGEYWIRPSGPSVGFGTRIPK